MIVRFNKRGAGGGSGPANYLMGKDRDREGAQVIRGDLEQTKRVIDSLNFKRNYTSGCLSFAEENIAVHQKSELMDSFESTIFNGLDRDQYEITWIEHTDKGRLELNYLIANVDLESGNRYQPYYDKVERPLVDSWQTIVNAHYDYADPNEPERAAALTHARDLPRNKLEASKTITNGLLNMAENGFVSSRRDVVATLSRHGFEVTRESEKFISIKDPSGGQNIRLKGGIYARDFRCGEGVRESIEARSREYQNSSEQRVQAAQHIYRGASAGKLARNEKRYSRTPETANQNIQKNQNSISDNHTNSNLHRGNVHTSGNRADLNRSSERRADIQQPRLTKHDGIRTTINAITRTATRQLRVAVQRIERQVKRIGGKWGNQAKQENSQRFEGEGMRQGVSGVQTRKVHSVSYSQPKS
jgi:hypothetical protein